MSAVPAETHPQRIADARLEPPRTARRLMPREALLQRLVEARRLRCIAIRSPAGCGKTSALVAWRQALLTYGYDSAWLTLTGQDNEPSHFFDGLIASLARADAPGVREASLLMGTEPAMLEHRVIALVQGLAHRSRPLVLMLDDVHHLHDPRVDQVLQWLLEYAPPTLHIGMTSRMPWPPRLAAQLARLQEQNRAMELRFHDLRFSADESARFLTEQLGTIEPQQARALHDQCDGWVAGLKLLTVAMKTSSSGAAEAPRLQDSAAFGSYVEQEVLRRLPPGDLDLLTRASACNRFCASLCRALSDDAPPRDAIELRLAHIDHDNLFLMQVKGPGNEGWYRLHPLLREVLLARLTAVGTEQQRALHQRAWQWFAEQQDVDEAVHHAVLAGQSDVAAALVEQAVRELLDRGELDRIMALVRRLPLTQVESRVALRFAQAHVHLYARALAALEDDVAALAAQPLDAEQTAELTLLRGSLALQRDDVDAVVALLPELGSWPDDTSDFMRTARAGLVAWAHMAQGDFERARQVLEQAAARQGGLGLRLTVRCLTGLSLSMEGRVLDAERLYRDVLQTAEDRGASFVGVWSMASALLADALYEADDVERACELLETRSAVIEHAAFPEAMLRTCIVLASAHWVSGRRLEALAQLDRLEDYASRDGLDRLTAHALALRVRLLQQMGDAPAAGIARAKLDRLALRHEGLGDAASREIGLLKLRADLAAHLRHGDFDAAAGVLHRLVEGTEEAARKRAAVALRLQLGLVEHSRGETARGDALLMDALRRAHRLGLVRTVLDASRHMPQALDALLQRQQPDAILAFYVRRVLQAAEEHAARTERPADQPAPAAPAEPLKDREREILSLLAQALPNKKIARIIGLSPETVKWHLKNIYAKLGVTGRDDAVARARDLQL